MRDKLNITILLILAAMALLVIYILAARPAEATGLDYVCLYSDSCQEPEVTPTDEPEITPSVTEEPTPTATPTASPKTDPVPHEWRSDGRSDGLCSKPPCVTPGQVPAGPPATGRGQDLLPVGYSPK